MIIGAVRLLTGGTQLVSIQVDECYKERYTVLAYIGEVSQGYKTRYPIGSIEFWSDSTVKHRLSVGDVEEWVAYNIAWLI